MEDEPDVYRGGHLTPDQVSRAQNGQFTPDETALVFQEIRVCRRCSKLVVSASMFRVTLKNKRENRRTI